MRKFSLIKNMYGDLVVKAVDSEWDDGVRHSVGGPAVLDHDEDSSVVNEEWWKYGSFKGFKYVK